METSGDLLGNDKSQSWQDEEFLFRVLDEKLDKIEFKGEERCGLDEIEVDKLSDKNAGEGEDNAGKKTFQSANLIDPAEEMGANGNGDHDYGQTEVKGKNGVKEAENEQVSKIKHPDLAFAKKREAGANVFGPKGEVAIFEGFAKKKFEGKVEVPHVAVAEVGGANH